MTIIAHYNGVLYSDRIHELPVATFAGNISKAKKLFINKDKTIAFCYTGLAVNKTGLDAIFSIFQSMFDLDNGLQDVNTLKEFVTDPHLDAVLQTERRFYLVMTKNISCFIKEGGIIYFDKNDLITDGLDGEYFQALALTGMDPKKIIPYVHDNLSRRVTKKFDCISRDQLKELKFIREAIGDNNIGSKKLAEKLTKIRKERG